MVDNVLDYDGTTRTMRWTERFPLFGHNPVLGLACTLAIVGMAWQLRIATDALLVDCR